ncbi:MAG: hypothetical protein SFX74_11130 [Fimbriimonadaceae bacterium]|nr:hypothetical protein [Fimbriimonadaceae bacterium]
MNENVKKIALVAIIVVAAVAVGFSVYNSNQGDKMIVDNVTKMPAGHKSEKELALESQGKLGQAESIERDLGGDLSGTSGGKN